jgi:heat-inducible transcriptional repressor
MELGERKKKILQLVINSYIETAEPVGSRFISKKNDLALSSATIRNEMADLEEMGYLEQPHTSSGRVPSQRGYRFYVDQLMEKYLLSITEMERVNQALKIKYEEIDKLIARACHIMSEITDFAAFAVTPKQDKSCIKKLDLVVIDQNSFLAVLVTDNAIVKNKLFKVNNNINEETLKLLAHLLNKTLENQSIGSITIDIINSLKRIVPQHEDVILPILSFVYDVVTQLEKSDVILNGANNLLKFPEFFDIQKAREFISFLEDKKEIGEMVKNLVTKEPMTKILIGKENENPNMQSSSIIINTYKLDDTLIGSIGLIGPIRMDYSKAVSDLEYFGHRLSLLMDEFFHIGNSS